MTSALLQNSFPQGGTLFSTLFLQFHKALIRHYNNGGKLYDPSKIENVCDKHATGTKQDIFDTTFKHQGLRQSCIT